MGEMKIPPFLLERFFVKHEFKAPYLMCSSDCESMPLGVLLDFEPNARAGLEKLWLGYTESLGSPALREAISPLYEKCSAEDLLVHAGAQEAIFSFMNVTLKAGGSRHRAMALLPIPCSTPRIAWLRSDEMGRRPA